MMGPPQDVYSNNNMPMHGMHPGMGAMPGQPMGGPMRMRQLKPPSEGFVQQVINNNGAYRTHPLFPLLRDLIIADMNFAAPTFPFQLIANLPGDFDKLLQNYLNRNQPSRHLPIDPQTDVVIMDALRYAHQSLISKIYRAWPPPPPLLPLFASTNKVKVASNMMLCSPDSWLAWGCIEYNPR